MARSARAHWNCTAIASVKFEVAEPEIESRYQVVKFQVSPAAIVVRPSGVGVRFTSMRR